MPTSSDEILNEYERLVDSYEEQIERLWEKMRQGFAKKYDLDEEELGLVEEMHMR